MSTLANAEESLTDDLGHLNSMKNSTLSTTDNAECTWQPKFMHLSMSSRRGGGGGLEAGHRAEI